MFRESVPPVLLAGLLSLAAMALASCDEPPAAKWAGPEKLVFWALMRGADHGQVYIRDERGITQLTDLPNTRELWRLDPPLVAFQTIENGGVDIHILNVDSAAHKTVLRLAGRLYKVPSPDGQRMIGEESGHLVVSSLQGSMRPRILGRSPGFPMDWNCAGDAVYFRDTDNRKIVNVRVDDGRQTDITPQDWPGLIPYYLSLSCDERVMAVVGGGDQLRIYKDGQTVKIIEAPDILGPHVSRDGAHVLYLLPHDDDTSKVMSYALASGEITELIGPIAAFGPVFLLEGR